MPPYASGLQNLCKGGRAFGSERVLRALPACTPCVHVCMQGCCDGRVTDVTSRKGAVSGVLQGCEEASQGNSGDPTRTFADGPGTLGDVDEWA